MQTQIHIAPVHTVSLKGNRLLGFGARPCDIFSVLALQAQEDGTSYIWEEVDHRRHGFYHGCTNIVCVNQKMYGKIML